MRINSLIGIALVSSILLVGSGQTAADVRQGSEVLIAKDEVIDDDLYVFAQKVTIDGKINGDLIVFGQQLSINGSVEGDLIAAAQLVLVNGKVSDDVRIAGQSISIQDGAEIGDDLIAASNSLECTKESRVAGEVKYAGYQSIFAGRVEKKVVFVSTNSELSGRFGGDVDAVVEGGNYGAAGFWGPKFPSVSQGLTVTPSAEIAGNLNYRSTREAIIDPDSTIVGNVEYSQLDSDKTQPSTIKGRIIAFAKQFFALLVVGLLVIYICPKWTDQVVNNVGQKPLISLGWGVMAMIAGIAAIILFLVAVIAIAVLLGYVSLDNLLPAWLWLGILSTGLVFAGFLVYAAWVTKVIVSVWVGNRIINGPEWVAKQRILVLGLGALVLCIVTRIPMVGSVVGLGVLLLGIGSTAIWIFNKSEPMIAEKQKA